MSDRSLQEKLIGSGLFERPETRGWLGDHARQVVAQARVVRVSADQLIRETRRILDGIIRRSDRHGNAAREALDKLEESIAAAIAEGQDLDDGTLDVFVWLTIDAFGDLVRLDVIGQDEVPPAGLSGTLTEVRRG
jgi:hypothetical protein